LRQIHNLALAQTAALAYDYPNLESGFANPARKSTFDSCVADGAYARVFSPLDGFAVGIGWSCVTVVCSAND
jgi:hypothetical protein